ncbi:ABC transporter substrate-binding protein [Enterocloster bolteae]|uniref:ABC transporter substrate-binding protein n=1 Tax=Enterocloster bolteae TaxID=208479 RepID=UPI00210CEADD|nr:ABC transporter substrate-binding protein [Enterocloster bolteae]MCQ5143873.1 ABC transporter substrate-binding protein [Enterocloster bolteae]
MKKRIFTVLLAAAVAVSLTACAGTAGSNPGGKTEETSASEGASKETAESVSAPKETLAEETPEQAVSDEKESGENMPEQSVVKWNCGTSGNVLLTIAEEKGYLKDEGITIEYVEANANADAMTLLATGKVDVVSNAGTSNPLQQIASGVDLTIFGGHMVEGCMPVVAKAGAQWNGIESFIGKKVAVNPSYFAFTGAVMDLGYDNPLEAVDWEIYSDYNDALAAVIRGDVEYALMGTGQNLAVQEMAKNGEIDIVSYQSEIMENYSCCRMEGQTQWVNDNPNTVKAIIRALLRAQSYYENNKEEAVKLHAAKIKATEEYVAAYMLDDEHYFVSVDPLKNSVKRAWDILDKTGFLDEKAKEINIDDHINTKLYEEALGEAEDAYGKEAPEFYQNMKTFFAENDK